jgi:hypothetical protein
MEVRWGTSINHLFTYPFSIFQVEGVIGAISVINQFDEKTKRSINDTMGVLYINKIDS